MGCCIRNCYGTELEEIQDAVKVVIPELTLEFLLDLTKCTNSQSQKNGLGNWNKLNIFIAKRVFDILGDLDKTNGYIDLSSPEKIFKHILKSIVDEFNELLCNGGSLGLDDLDNKYNTDRDGNLINKFPPNMSNEDRDKINDILDDNNFFDDNNNGGNNGGNNIVVDNNGNGNGNNDYNNGNGNGSGNGSDGTNGSGNGNGSGDGSGNGNGGNNGNGNGNGSGNDGPLSNIPNDEIIDLDLSQSIFKCFTPVFHIENYVFNTTNSKTPIFLTSDRVKKLKRIHNEIMLPIYNYYFGENTIPSCQIRITFGLSSYHDTRVFIGGGAFSKHILGEAIDFNVVGISTAQVVDDIRDKKFPLNFGVMYDKGGLHLTLPYTFENLDVKRMYLSSPRKGRESLEVEFV